MRAVMIALLAVVSAPAFAQVRVQVQLPSIVFPAPPHLYLAAPGVQVVEDYDDEVFFSDNYYWHRSGDHWFRTRTHDGAWVSVEPRWVPRPIYRTPPGTYRRWHHRPDVRRYQSHERHDEGHEHRGNR